MDQALVPEYRADAFGAHFVLANAGRRNVVLNGEDNLSLVGSSVNAQTYISGRVLILDEAQKVVAKDDDAIRQRGRNEIELTSQWIQNKEMAQELAEWIRDHWSALSDELNVEIFGNPLFELGDLVDINYPKKDMSPANYRYFVVGIQTAFDTGLATSLTLRRCKL